ncbi:MAG: hypothetical protein V8Q95_08610 [Collinsella sp.]
MGKKSRARVAAAGTRKDPGRRVAEGKKADRAEKDKKVGAHAHPEWAPHLNTASEDLTAKLFTLVEVILGVVPLVVIGLFLASKDATSVDKLTDVFSQDPSMVVTFISACLQPFVAYNGAAVANMQRLYRAIEPAGSAKTRAISLVEGLVHDYSLLDGLAHRVTTELPERTGNLGHLTWKNPFTDEVSNESFPEVFDRALVDYECTVARFIETGDMDAVTSHVNYSGRVLGADEEFDREE